MTSDYKELLISHLGLKPPEQDAYSPAPSSGALPVYNLTAQDAKEWRGVFEELADAISGVRARGESFRSGPEPFSSVSHALRCLVVSVVDGPPIRSSSDFERIRDGVPFHKSVRGRPGKAMEQADELALISRALKRAVAGYNCP